MKVIHERLAADPGFVRRFDRDAQVVAALEHPHIVPVYDHWREPGNAYVVTRYLRGGSFEGPPADRADAIRMLEQLAGALASAHRRDIVHGAITGTNVLLDADGNAYLADFPIGVDRPGSTAAGDVADLIALFPGLVSTASEDVGSLLTNLHQAGWRAAGDDRCGRRTEPVQGAASVHRGRRRRLPRTRDPDTAAAGPPGWHGAVGALPRGGRSQRQRQVVGRSRRSPPGPPIRCREQRRGLRRRHVPRGAPDR